MTAPLSRESLARASVERSLARRLRAEEWTRLRRDPSFGSLTDSPSDADFADECAQLVRAWRTESESVARLANEQQSRRVSALTMALTASAYLAASSDMRVQTFRAAHVPDVMEVSDVLGWVRSMASGAELSGHGYRGWSTLSVPTSGGFTRPQIVQHGGVLDDLRRLAGELSDEHRWGDSANGVAFLLADIAPLVFPVQSSNDSAGWVTLRVHRGMAAHEVAAEYQRVRPAGATGRSRTFDEKTLRAAAFCSFRPGEWPGRWRRWNIEHHGEEYSSWRAFRSAVVGVWHSL